MNFSIRKVLQDFAKENKETVTTYLLLSLAFPINDVALPYYYGKVIDQASSSTKATIWKNTRRYVLIITVLWSLKQILISKLDSLDAVFLPKLQSYVRQAIVSRILLVYQERYKDPEVGRFLTQITKLPFIVRDLFHQVRYFVIPVVLVVLFTLVYLFYVHPSLGGIYLIGITIFLGIIWWFCNSCFPLSNQKEKVHMQLNEEITDLLSNMLNVYSADTVNEELKRIEKLQEELNEYYKEAINCASGFKTIFNIAYLLIFVSINGYAFFLYTKGKITIGSLSSVLIVTLFIIGMLESTSREIRDFAANIGVLQRAQKAINDLGLVPPDGEVPKFDNGELLVKDLKITHGGTEVVHVPYLHINNGETVAIVGETGCGKSSFAKAIAKLTKYEGKIYIGGQDTQNTYCQMLRKHVVYIPQEPRLFNRSVLENITYGSSATKEDVINAIREMGIHQISESDLERSAGKNGNNLSGGQRQIVYFLRFFFRKGTVFILDEPTSALDAKSRDQVLNILQRISNGKTTLIITHDPQIINSVSRVISLE